MILLFTIITVLMGGSMFFISREKKIALMYIGCMTLTLLHLDIPLFYNANFFFVGCFLLSEFNYWEASLIQLKTPPLGMILLAVLISVILCLLFSPHLDNIDIARGFIQEELFLKYFALGYAFISIRNEKNLRTLIRYSIIPMFILTFMGLINLIDNRSFLVTEMMANHTNEVTEMAGDIYKGSERFRVQAMFRNPFDYGYICLLCLLIYIYGYTKKMIDSRLFTILLLCCVFGILMCGCRTIIFSSILGVSSMLLLTNKLGKSISYSIAATSISVVIYLTVPIVNEKVNEMTTIFSDRSGQKIGGSNLDMRSIQFATVLYYIQDSPAFGRGYQFFYNDMGWGDDNMGSLKDRDLYGIEGVYLLYLLERGFVGYFLYLLVWLLLLVYLYKYRYYDRELYALGVSVWVSYVVFANMTGELLSPYPTLLIIGSVFGVINTKKS